MVVPPVKLLLLAMTSVPSPFFNKETTPEPF